MRKRIRLLNVDTKTKARLLHEESKFGYSVERLAVLLDMKPANVMAESSAIICHAQKHNYGIVQLGPDLQNGTNLVIMTCARCDTSVQYYCNGGDIADRASGYHYHLSDPYLFDGRAQGVSSIEFKAAVAYLHLVMQVDAYETGTIAQLRLPAELIAV